jgi:radical SAM superfamily enzyme YgiQ (UPF0313 family)
MLTDLVPIESAEGATIHAQTTGAEHKKVVLLLPPYSGPPLGPPAGLLALAAVLREAAYPVTIIDGVVTPDYLKRVEHETEGALCFGVSLLTGPMIDGAVAAARLVKKLRPDLPVIFGGWHPSLLPEPTLREFFVDIVVRNQGERTLLEVVRRLEHGRSLEGVAGCSFKREGRLVNNPDRAVSSLTELPAPAYDLADFNAYERAGGKRTLPYATSVGCPYACSYCTDTVFYNRRFNALPAERVVDEVTRLVHEHRIREVSLLDSNFLVETRRAVKIAQGFLAAGARFDWAFQASTDLLCRMSDEDVALMARSGLRHIGFGTESGSAEVLALMNKPHQTIPDMFEAARKTQQANIRATFNLIFGFPGETDEHRSETLRVMAEITARFDNVTFSPNVFTPYPGIPAWPELERRGLRQPDSLEGWRDLALHANFLPWIQGETGRRVRRSMSLFLLANELTKQARQSNSPATRLWLRLLRKPLSWRLRRQFFRWPVELWFYPLRQRVAMRRSLLTGQELICSMD